MREVMISRLHASCAAMPAHGVCGLLSSNLIHRPFGLDELLAVDAVAGLFVPDAVADEIGELSVAAAAAKHGAGVPFDGREQTVADLPFRGETEAIAVFAERLRDGVDETDHAAVGIGEVARRLARIRAV